MKKTSRRVGSLAAFGRRTPLHSAASVTACSGGRFQLMLGTACAEP
jgi:hypothetical protein